MQRRLETRYVRAQQENQTRQTPHYRHVKPAESCLLTHSCDIIWRYLTWSSDLFFRKHLTIPSSSFRRV